MIPSLVESDEEESSWGNLLGLEDSLGHFVKYWNQQERLVELDLAGRGPDWLVKAKALFSLFMSFHFFWTLKTLLVSSLWTLGWYLLLNALISSWWLGWYLPFPKAIPLSMLFKLLPLGILPSLPTTAAATAELSTRTMRVERPLITGHCNWPLTTLSYGEVSWNLDHKRKRKNLIQWNTLELLSIEFMVDFQSIGPLGRCFL